MDRSQSLTDKYPLCVRAWRLQRCPYRNLLAAVFLGLGAIQGFGAERSPNLLLILLDDSGWTDLGCYGSNIQTPNMDALAKQGMRFTDCHSAAPNCSPSRAGLLTGRIPPRAGIYSYLPNDHVMHLRDEERTIAEVLKQKGYATGHFGKWHLSTILSDQPGPKEQGFDYSLGTDNNASPSHLNPKNFVRNGKPVGQMEGYSCQIVVDETIQWLERTKRENNPPFFSCVWFHEPHTPIASPPELTAKYQRLFPSLNKKQAAYHANIENVDQAIGKLLSYLQDADLEDDTMVFLSSDNGPLNRFSRAGLRGQKSNVWEGGHRVPGIIRWPGRVQPGSICSVPVSGVDYFPTVCDIVGIDVTEDLTLDGTSILPLLSNKPEAFQRTKALYWFFYRLNPGLAIRSGEWSLVATTNDAQRPKAHPLLREDIPYIQTSRPTSFQLFHLKRDLGQQHDLSKTEPEVLSRLQSEMQQLHQDVIQEGYKWDIPEGFGVNSKRRLWESE